MKKSKFGYYLLDWATYHNNIEIAQLLIEYALQHQINLEYDKNSKCSKCIEYSKSEIKKTNRLYLTDIFIY